MENVTEGRPVTSVTSVTRTDLAELGSGVENVTEGRPVTSVTSVTRTDLAELGSGWRT